MVEHTIEEKKNLHFVNTGFRVTHLTHSINEDLLHIKRSCRSFIGVIVPYEISKVNFHVETKIFVSMSEEI
jgi:hypothetical protein